MPRFNAEGTESALMEMMKQQLLKDMMFENAPARDWRSKQFNLSRENQSSTSLDNLFARKNPGPYDPVYGPEPYDDTKTSNQSAREDEELNTGIGRSQIQRIRPPQYNDPGSGRNFLDQLPPASTLGFPPGSPMNEAYERMPYPGAPRYPMQVMPEPFSDPAMSQLMGFYSNEDI